MDAQAGKSPHPLVWVSAIALIVFCSAGVGALMGWIPVFNGTPDRIGQELQVNVVLAKAVK